jgi:hypothetical protein
MKSFAVPAMGLSLCIGLAACSETGVLDKMGLGKSAPDETQVTTNNTLAMPPDLTLRQPAPGQTDERQVNRAAVAAVPATPPDAYAAAPAQPTEVASAEQSGYDTGQQQLTTTPGAAPTAAPTVLGPAVQSTQKTSLTGNSREDAFIKYGISKTRPDGTPKTRAELDRELLEAVRAEKRRKNPNYGTVFNMRNVFKNE